MNQQLAHLGSEAARHFARARERFAVEATRALVRRQLDIRTQAKCEYVGFNLSLTIDNGIA